MVFDSDRDEYTTRQHFVWMLHVDSRLHLQIQFTFEAFPVAKLASPPVDAGWHSSAIRAEMTYHEQAEIACA
jgi:hypothetical protein